MSEATKINNKDSRRTERRKTRDTISTKKQEILDKSPLHGLWALTNRELKKWYKTPVLLFMSLIQPIIWISLYGRAFNFGTVFATGALNIPGVDIPKEALNSLTAQIVQGTFGTSDYFSFFGSRYAFICGIIHHNV